MGINRRDFLISAGLAAASGVTTIGTTACRGDMPGRQQSTADEFGTDTWNDVRAHFELDPEYIHLAGLLLSSHPQPVRAALEEHRRALNQNPTYYVQEHNSPLKARVREAAARYMGVNPNEIALTDSTTMGTALVITGLQVSSGQEMLTAHFDYYSTHESLRYQARRSGATIRETPLYQDIQTVTEDEIVDTLLAEIRPETRLITATWVHSATGLKVPIRSIAEQLAEINKNRSGTERVIFFVDGVHGFGVENVLVADLGCDFFAAGAHKWLLGPRGTGVMWGHPQVHDAVSPTIPTFTYEAGWGGRMTPGGFKPFEHEWALTEAFEFHQKIGKARIQARIHTLAGWLKEGLASMDHVTLYTPLDNNLSSGIVCFDVDGFTPLQVVHALHRRRIIASETPYSPSCARFTPGIYNTEEEIEEVLRAVYELS